VRGSHRVSQDCERRYQDREDALYATIMLNLTLVINCAATVALAASVVFMKDAELAAIALAYTSGLLTSLASRYQVGVASDD
jgi:hypothetical protein